MKVWDLVHAQVHVIPIRMVQFSSKSVPYSPTYEGLKASEYQHT